MLPVPGGTFEANWPFGLPPGAYAILGKKFESEGILFPLPKIVDLVPGSCFLTWDWGDNTKNVDDGKGPQAKRWRPT